MRMFLILVCTLAAAGAGFSSPPPECVRYQDYIHMGASLDFDGGILSIGAAGRYALVARGSMMDPESTDVLIVDLLDLEAPVVTGGLATAGQVVDVAANGTLAYLADMGTGLLVVDISSPGLPCILGRAEIPGAVRSVAVGGNYAYVTEDYSGLHVVDISDPRNPIVIGSIDTPGYALDVAVSGSYAYVADHRQGLQIVDVSNPSAPVIAATMDTLTEARELYIAGTHAYVSDWDIGLFIIDISEPLLPRTESIVPIFCWGISGTDSMVVAADGCRVSWIDVSDPRSPRISFRIDVPESPEVVCLTDSYCLVGDNWYVNAGSLSSLEIFPFEILDEPPVMGLLDGHGASVDVEVIGTTAYLADGGVGLHLADVGDGSAPALLGGVDTPGFAGGVAIQGQFAYVADGSGGLQVVDISEPEMPFVVGTFATPGSANDVAVHSDYAYVADHKVGFLILDVSDPANPFLLGSIGHTGWARGGAVLGNLLYGLTNDGLRIIDVSDPASPLIIASLPVWANDIEFQGTLAFLAGGGGLVVLDVSVPESPSILGSCQAPGVTQGVSVAGFHAYLACGEAGLQVADVSDPHHPRLLGGSYLVNDANAVGVTETAILLAGGSQFGFECFNPINLGLVIYPPQCLDYTHTLPDPEPEPVYSSQLRNSRPNPIRGSSPAVIPFDLAQAGAVTLGIYNLNGTHVRSLLDTWLEAGGYEVPWDGRDENGRMLPAGVYFYRLKAQGFEGVRRLIWLP